MICGPFFGYGELGLAPNVHPGAFYEQGILMSETTYAGMTCKILIIEDDHDDDVLLRRALTKSSSKKGLRVELQSMRNGLEGLSSVARQDLLTNLPDIVVVDLNMPVVGGEDFLRLLRQELQLPDLPAVVLTTSSERPIHDRALAAGANKVFVKPNTLAELETIAGVILETAFAPGQ